MERRGSFDVIKIIACFFVILIHVKTPLTEFYFPYIRCAVPAFFCMAGYFSWKNERTEYLTTMEKQLKYFVRVFVLISIFYVIINGITITKQNIIKLLVFNEPWYGTHLWYIAAYIYVLILVVVCSRFRALYEFIQRNKMALFLIPIMLFTDLLMGSYSKLAFGEIFPNYYTRNFLFEGIPYFVGGGVIRRHQDVLQFKNLYLPFILLLAGIIITFFEVSFMESRQLMTPRYNFIGTIVTTFSFMIIAINSSKGKVGLFEIIAKHYILPVYLFHPFCASILNNSFLPYTFGYDYLLPLYCFIFVIFSIRLIEYVKR